MLVFCIFLILHFYDLYFLYLLLLEMVKIKLSISKHKHKNKHNTKNKTKHNKNKHNKTKHNKTNKICTISSNYLQSLIKPDLYNQYKKYIKNIATIFITSQNPLLNTIFNIKHNNQNDSFSFNIKYKEEVFNEYTKIPNFIDIFRYLINIDSFNNKFTKDEQSILHKNLSTQNTKTSCYDFLDKSPLGNKLLTAYNSIRNDKTNIIYMKLIEQFQSIEFYNLLINSFTSYKILEDLELKITKLVTFSVTWKNHTYENLIYLFMYDNSLDKSKYIKFGQQMFERIFFFNEFLNTNNMPDKFIIFLTDKKKEIDISVLSHVHFKTININTAVTNGVDIIIYREQELLKSIFHELIHFHKLDFRHIPDNIIKYLISTHNINNNNEYLLYECVTESLANILNNIYVSGTINEFASNLESEILFSTLQVAKILSVCKYKSWSDFTDTTNTTMNTTMNTTVNKNKYNNNKTQFKQDSCVFSYYILKFYILLNLDNYFKSVLDNKLKFIQDQKHFTNLTNIFDSSRSILILQKIMDNILSNLSKKRSTKSKNISNKKYTKISKTLRMTCLENSLLNDNAI